MIDTGLNCHHEHDQFRIKPYHEQKGGFWTNLEVFHGGSNQILNHQCIRIQSPKFDLIHSMLLIQHKGTRMRT